jgi:hypothetical protein
MPPTPRASRWPAASTTRASRYPRPCMPWSAIAGLPPRRRLSSLPATPDYGIAAPPAPALCVPGGTPGPTAVLLTATSRDDKLWPEDHWAALGRELHARGLHCLLPAGNSAERERATRIADRDSPGKPAAAFKPGRTGRPPRRGAHRHRRRHRPGAPCGGPGPADPGAVLRLRSGAHRRAGPHTGFQPWPRRPAANGGQGHAVAAPLL